MNIIRRLEQPSMAPAWQRNGHSTQGSKVYYHYINIIFQGNDCQLDTPPASPSLPTQLLQQKIDDLEQIFRRVFTDLFFLLSTIVSKCPDFIHYFRSVVLTIKTHKGLKYQHSSFFAQYREAINKATEVAQFQSIFGDYCTFLNVSLLECVVKDLGYAPFSSSDYEEHFLLLEEYKNVKLNVYISRLRDFRVSTKLVDFIEALRLRQDGSLLKLPKNFEKIKLKLGVSWEYSTLEEAEQFRLDVSDVEKVVSYASDITNCEHQCIILTWGVLASSVSSFLHALDAAGRERYDIEAVDCDATVVKPLPAENPTIKTADPVRLEPADSISQVQPRNPVQHSGGGSSEEQSGT